MTLTKDIFPRLIHVFTVLGLLLLGAVIFYNNYLSHFTSDDYLYSFKFNPGFVGDQSNDVQYEKIQNPADYFDSLWLLYQNLTGRIVPHGILQIILLFPSWVFDVLNTLVFLLWAWLITQWLGIKECKLRLQYWYLIAILLYLAISNTIPNLYYPAFSCNYIWSQLIILAFLWSVRKLLNPEENHEQNILLAFALFVFGMVAGNTNEPLVPGVLLALCSWGLYLIISRKKLPAWYFAAVTGCLIGFIIMFLAPGNHSRVNYESQHRLLHKGITLDIHRIKLIIYSSLGAVPVLGIAFISFLAGPKLKTKDLFPLAIISLTLIGVLLALLASPFYLHRMNALFIGFAVLISMYMVSICRLSKTVWIFVITILTLPVFSAKILSDAHRLTKARQELIQFEQQISNTWEDTISVAPRAYLDPITRPNWAKPIATYYGKAEIKVFDVLDEQHYKNSQKVKYEIDNQNSIDSIRLLNFKYHNHNDYSGTAYIVLQTDTLTYPLSDFDLSLYSKDIKFDLIQNIFEKLPVFLRKYMMENQPWFQPPLCELINGEVIIATVFKNEKRHYDYLRIRISAGEKRISDIMLRDVEFPSEK